LVISLGKYNKNKVLFTIAFDLYQKVYDSEINSFSSSFEFNSWLILKIPKN